MKNLTKELTNYIRSGISGIHIVTSEENRAVGLIEKVARNELANSSRPSGYSIWLWTVTKGLRNQAGEMVKINIKTPIPGSIPVTFTERLEQDQMERTKDPLVALQAIQTGGISTRSIIILKDFHMHLKSFNPMLIRMLKETIEFGRKTSRHIIIVGCECDNPPELEKEIVKMELPLPTRNDLEVMLNNICENPSIRIPSVNTNSDMERILDSMSGMTISEASDSVILSITEHKKIIPEFIHKIKVESMKKNSVVEIVEDNVSMDEIGGLDKFKKHISSISNSFSREARDYGLDQPKPILSVGNPGTAKSLTSMAMKTALRMQLIRVEAGRLFGSFVGESERNWRNAFAAAKAMSPCIFWIDEAEGLFVGAQSSGQCDGGTTNRLVKTVLQDMQMNSDGVFFVLTSNDIDGFPDPLIDRCDVWMFDLPSINERESIWSIHIKKRKRKPKDYNIKELAERTDGFSGRQIEQVWVRAMRESFNDNKREPRMEDVISVLKQFVPTSVTMKHQIERRRERLKNRAQSAS